MRRTNPTLTSPRPALVAAALAVAVWWSSPAALSAQAGAPVVPELRPAADYVVEKFTDHDIVLLGEMHYVKQNLDFVIELIPRLQAAGVHHLGWEFAHYQDQPRIDRLITAPEYDEELARSILLAWHAPGRAFPYQEYVDVFRAAWQANRGLAPGDRPFRVVALGVPDRPQDVSTLRPGERPMDTAVRNRMLGGHFYDVVNIFWAQVIDREIISQGVPALIYAGAGHTYTKFFHDRRRPEHGTAPSPDPRRGIAAGNLVYNQIGDRAVRINLHGSAGVSAGRAVEASMRALPGGPARGTGFDLAGTVFGAAPVLDIRGYRDGRASDFTLQDIADGYVFLAPAAEWEPVTLIEGFVTPRTRHRIQMSLSGGNPEQPALSVEEVQARAARQLESSVQGLIDRFARDD